MSIPKHAVVVVGCLWLLVAASACWNSADSTRSENSISPYDPEFEPSADEKAKLEKQKNADETEEPVGENDLLVEAMKYYDSGLFTAAKEGFQKLQEKFPSSYYSLLAELKVADCSYRLGDYTTAITQYQEFLRLHPKHEAIPYVVLQIGNSYFAQYRGVIHDQSPAKEALKYFEQVVKEYPSSSYAISASESITRCKDTIAAHEAYVAEFYAKQGLSDASKNRLGFLQREHAGSQAERAAAAALGAPQQAAAKASVEPGPAVPKPVSQKQLALLAAETLPPIPLPATERAKPTSNSAPSAELAKALPPPSSGAEAPPKSEEAARARLDSASAGSATLTAARSPEAAEARRAAPVSTLKSSDKSIEQSTASSTVKSAEKFTTRATAKGESAVSAKRPTQRERVAVAASVTCEQRADGKTTLTTQFVSPEVVQGVTLRRSSVTQATPAGKRSLVLEVDLTSSATGALVALGAERSCTLGGKAGSATKPIGFVEVPPAASAGPGIRTVRIEIPLTDAQQWRVLKLEQPERVVALFYE